MSTQSFSELLKQKKFLVSDGATGTNLIQRGLPQGTSAEDWVLNKPEAITSLHNDFFGSRRGYHPDLYVWRFPIEARIKRSR